MNILGILGADLAVRNGVRRSRSGSPPTAAPPAATSKR
jgi:hypothetical protein